MIINESLTLSNGTTIPKLGFGTWLIPDADAAEAVKAAIGVGYTHIDTAQAYKNEHGVGEGIRASGVARDELFVTTKLAAEIKTFDAAVAAIDGSLEALGLDYVDLMIIHSPKPWRQFHGDDHFFEGNREAWRALEAAYTAGKLRSIGVSNFEEVDLDNILENGDIPPMVNQILVHISNTPTALIEYSQGKGVVVEAYSPVGHGELLKNEAVKAIADRYGVSVPQLAIRYTLQLGLVSLPKTVNPAHMKSNTEVDFEISADDMQALANVKDIDDYGDASAMPVFGKKK